MVDGFNLVKIHNVFVNSKNRDAYESPADMTIEIPSGFIQISDPTTQRMKVSLMSFTGHYNWTEVNETNNSIIFKNLNTNISTTVTLAHGNYPLQKMAKVISTMYPQVQCTHVSETNKFVFNFGVVPHGIQFVGASYDVIGFTPMDDGINGIMIASTQTIKPMKRLNIYVRLLDVLPSDECLNLDNFNSVHLQPSNVLCAFPINGQPWQSINFNDTSAGDTFGMWISNTHLTKLRFQLTDCDGEVLDFIDDYEAIFQIGIWDEDNKCELNRMVDKLNSIDSSLKNMALMKYIGRGGRI